MFHTPSKKQAYWVGFLHALGIVLYTIFISLIWLSLAPMFKHTTAPALQLMLFVLILLLSLAVCSYTMFFEPIKLVVHHQFKTATILFLSTLGWLFLFLILGIMIFIQTYYS